MAAPWPRRHYTADAVTIALVSARAARDLDEDLPPLIAAFRALDRPVSVVDWDDPNVDWRAFELALLRSTWDYATRLEEFFAWLERTARLTRLVNPLPVVRWNTDKHYLADLARDGIPTVPSEFVEPGDDASRALARFRVAHLADAMGTELSSGQRTLIGIVRATLHRPRLLVLDEPTASLDPDVALRVRTGLLDLSREFGCALLMTSHDMSDVEQVCERVVFLSHGTVVADAPPGEVAASYGHGDLASVFLQLAAPHDDTHAQQSDHP